MLLARLVSKVDDTSNCGSINISIFGIGNKIRVMSSSHVGIPSFVLPLKQCCWPFRFRFTIRPLDWNIHVN